MKKVKKIQKVKKKEVLNEKKFPRYRIDNTYEGENISDILFNNDIHSLTYNDEDYTIEKIFSVNDHDKIKIQYASSTTEFTCGFVELGDLNINNIDEKYYKDAAKILDEIVIHSENYTLFMNTNGEDDCIIFEKILPLTKHWKLVKEYINPSSENTLKLWVTNN